MSTFKNKSLYQKAGKTQTFPEGCDKRPKAYRRCVNALKKMTDSAIEFLEKAKPLRTEYVTCFFWFGNHKTIRRMKNPGYDIISQLSLKIGFCRAETI